jgi:hypothetical protein
MGLCPSYRFKNKNGVSGAGSDTHCRLNLKPSQLEQIYKYIVNFICVCPRIVDICGEENHCHRVSTHLQLINIIIIIIKTN